MVPRFAQRTTLHKLSINSSKHLILCAPSKFEGARYLPQLSIGYTGGNSRAVALKTPLIWTERLELRSRLYRFYTLIAHFRKSRAIQWDKQERGMIQTDVNSPPGLGSNGPAIEL